MIPRILVSICAGALFAQDVKSILETKCMVCHGQAKMSGFDMRDRASLLRGGSRGAAVVPGKPGQSLLFRAVRGEGELRMPPGKSSLTSEEIETIRLWIAAGAPMESGSLEGAVWWSFRAPRRPKIPGSGFSNPIDAFLTAKAREKELTPAGPASRETLLRRAYFDLTGLPPSPADVEEFLADTAKNAFEARIDKLLASPRYGERWGRYWLDLVRYADTSGFETDHFYVNAWRYRDYVIRAFNEDKPYDIFVREQIAADEIWPPDIDLEGTSKLPREKELNLQRRIATGLFTVGSFPIEYTYHGDLFRAEWQNEAIDTIGSAFLGLTLGCARCHDHKFDPITQRDYYRLAATFAGSVEQELPLGSLFDIQTSTRSFPLLAQAEAWKQMARRARAGGKPVSPELLQKLGEAYLRAPDRAPVANVLGHDHRVHDTHVLIKGDFKAKGERVEPGFPAALPPAAQVGPLRRKALAEWLTSPEQPLLARVMVNRIWQGHFGEGIVRTPNDFGRQGEPPTHPELLDWLAVEFASRGYSIKQMHKLIMLSAAYQAESVASPEALKLDPENRLFTRMNRRRLDADAIRDATLAVAGTLNLRMGGVGIIPAMSAEELQAARMPNLWPIHPDPNEHNRRSVYLQMKRSLTLPMLQVFDAPDSSTSCARRERSTVAPQALARMNSEFTFAQANAFAERIRKTVGEPVVAAWRIAFGRTPSREEHAVAAAYLERNNLERLALLVLNMNEFLYVD